MLDMAVLGDDDVILCLIVSSLIFMTALSVLYYSWSHA